MSVLIISTATRYANMITSSPVELGSDMEVTCAASTVGGPQVFTCLGKDRALGRIRLIVNKTDILANYLIQRGPASRLKVN